MGLLPKGQIQALILCIDADLGWAAYQDQPDTLGPGLAQQLRTRGELSPRQVSVARAMLLPHNWLAVRIILTSGVVEVRDSFLRRALSGQAKRPTHRRRRNSSNARGAAQPVTAAPRSEARPAEAPSTHAQAAPASISSPIEESVAAHNRATEELMERLAQRRHNRPSYVDSWARTPEARQEQAESAAARAKQAQELAELRAKDEEQRRAAQAEAARALASNDGLGAARFAALDLEDTPEVVVPEPTVTNDPAIRRFALLDLE